MKIDCISDLHGFFPKLSGGDLLIVAGDLTAKDTDKEHLNFIEWLVSHQENHNKYNKVIYIAGNHDNFLYDKERYGKIQTKEKWNIEYLCDSGVEYKGLKIWGSPWTKTFEGMNPKCKAFTCENDEELDYKWSMIPIDIDILVTHSPPNGILDFVGEKNCGSISLRIQILKRIKPKLHIFGHIHEWGGKDIDLTTTRFINASYVNENYQPVNKPVRIEI